MPFLTWNQLSEENRYFLDLHFTITFTDFLTPHQLKSNTSTLTGWSSKLCRHRNVNLYLQFIHELDNIIL